MKITAIEVTYDVAPPRERPIRDALQTLDGGGSVKVAITAQDGTSDRVVGTSSTGFGRLRAVTVGPDGALFVSTANGPGDRIVRVTR